ncbi:MAG: peptidase S8 [Fimbriimonadaceae bacterium]|nr:peptidase S8 [Fimbriimonadaceae bacterium]QYK57824.1 MAG: peptidase S8 [Fimbriimonadaceae bacterium]
MFKHLATATFLGLVALAAASPVEFVDGEVLVKFREGSQIVSNLENARIGATPVETLRALGVQRVQLPRTMSVGAAVAFYRTLPFVEFAEPNYIARTFQVTPNDPRYPNQYALPKISAPTGWTVTTGSSSVVIAIVDTGIDKNHTDLNSKFVAGYDFVNNDSDPDDDNGHGTHCAGIAAAVTNNANGVAGVDWNARLMGVKVLNASGSGSFSAISNGITWAADNGAKVISLSLGASSGSSTLESAVNYAWNRNVVVVAAAGNSNTSSPSYPAFYTNCIAVGSTDQNDARSSFSNFGASWVDVAAPGTSILSTYDGNTYATLSGTSMACPAVAGLAGLLWAKNGLGSTNTSIRAAIEDNCDPVGTWVAKGRINVARALGAGGGGGGGGSTTTNYAPSSVQVFTGTVVGGSASSLATSDNVRFDLRSGGSGSTRVVDYDAILTGINRGSGITQLVVTVENQMTISGSLGVYLYNYSTGSYVQIASQSVGTGDTTNSYTVTSGAGNYVSGSGECRVGFYRSRSGATTYNLRSDFVRVAVTANN